MSLPPFPERPESQDIQALRILYQGVAQLMATFDDLVTVTNTLVANDKLFATEVSALTDSVNRLVTDFDDLKKVGVLTADQQAKLDAAVEAVTGASADLATSVANMDVEQQMVDTADPAPAPPAPQAAEHKAHQAHEHKA